MSLFELDLHNTVVASLFLGVEIGWQCHQRQTSLCCVRFLRSIHEHLHGAERGKGGLKPLPFPDVPIYDALKSAFVVVFADREAIADGLNPLTISQTARTSSCTKIENARGM